jgi:hypothetical protein
VTIAAERSSESSAPSADAFTCLGVLLGPYRNLSTLTAVALALHPSVQVLNHAAERLWRMGGVDFIERPEADVYRRFLSVAVRESAGGARGQHGGSILHAHAFDAPALRHMYARRFGDAGVKPDASCLVWKDSMRIQNRLMAREATLPSLLAGVPDARFILPVRQPLDCALSNIRTGKSQTLLARASDALPDVLDAVLAAIVWVLKQRDRWPERFYVFTEKADARDVALGLARFLRLPSDAQWTEDFTAAFQPRPTSPDAGEKALERKKIASALAPWPDIRDPLLG